MVETREYEGHKFHLDDSLGCYIEVSLGEQTGYVGVNLTQGTPESPYCWYNNNGFTTPEGLTKGNVSGSTVDDNLHALYRNLIGAQAKAEAHGKFDPAAACKALHEYMSKQPEG